MELLSLLTAKVQHFAMAPGGVPDITADDLAFALATIENRNAVRYARLKYAHDLTVIEDLALAMRQQTTQFKSVGKWREGRKNWILDMCYLALIETIDPLTCPWCLGQEDRQVRKPGKGYRVGQIIRCDACKGTGRRKLRAVDRAKLMGIDQGSWSRPWAPRYEDIIAMPLNWDGEIVTAVNKKIA